MTYQVELSNRAAKDLDRLGGEMRSRIIQKLERLSGDPYDVRLSAALTNHSGLRKSLVGGWRIIFNLDDEKRVLYVVTIERRGQVYQRI